jgi:hypothetical protein
VIRVNGNRNLALSEFRGGLWTGWDAVPASASGMHSRIPLRAGKSPGQAERDEGGYMILVDLKAQVSPGMRMPLTGPRISEWVSRVGSICHSGCVHGWVGAISRGSRDRSLR